MRKKVVYLIKHLKNEGKISENEIKKLFPRGARPGILYESTKVHKLPVNNCSKFYPVLSAI